MSRATRMYVGFHQHDPKKVGEFHRDLVIPSTAVCVGVAKNVLYRSDKLNPETGEDEGWIDYIHEHDRGVKVYRCDQAADGDDHTVPAFIRRCQELVWLGYSLGFAWDDGEAKATKPLPELYTIPSGRALVVIQDKRRVLALIWGGKLGVEPRGIVH